MKTIRLIVPLAVLLLSGCASYRLPPITAAEIHYNRKDLAGGTVITAKNVRVEADKVKAESASWVTTYPAFSITVTVKDYERAIKE